jgi:dynein heavy chain
MEEGKTLIIEGIENDVDPMLDPVLEKQVQTKGKNQFIDVGGTQIDYCKTFQLFMTSRLPNPSFSPELSAKTTIIDFTVTQGGLEQQLLGQVLSKE